MIVAFPLEVNYVPGKCIHDILWMHLNNTEVEMLGHLTCRRIWAYSRRMFFFKYSYII